MSARTCRYCHSLIDPVDYCTYCAEQKASGRWALFCDCPLHERFRRGPAARYCDRLCRERHYAEKKRAHPVSLRRPCKRTGVLPGLEEKGRVSSGCHTRSPRPNTLPMTPLARGP